VKFKLNGQFTPTRLAAVELRRVARARCEPALIDAASSTPVSDGRSHAEVDELQLDDLIVGGDDAVEDAADARRVDARVVGRRHRAVPCRRARPLHRHALARYSVSVSIIVVQPTHHRLETRQVLR